MKKTILISCMFLLLLATVSVAQMTEDQMYDLGCELRDDGRTYCMRPSYRDLVIKFNDDVYCYSSMNFSGCSGGADCLAMADIGCFSEVSIIKDEIFTYKYLQSEGDDWISYWENESFEKGEWFDAAVNPAFIDSSKCSVVDDTVVNNSLVNLVCIYEGESYEAQVDVFPDYVILVLSLKAPPGPDFTMFIYIGLAAIIALIFIWILYSKRKQFKPIKKVVKVAPKKAAKKPVKRKAHYRRGKSR